MTAREWAHKLADAGMPVFPLYGVREVNGILYDLLTAQPATKEDGSGKRPKGSWPDQATTDHSEIDRWFDEDEWANYGVKLGSGLLVVDCDTFEEAEQFEEALAAESGDWVHTFKVRTARGMHYYFQGDSRTFKLGPDVDLKAAGGYVVGPGCRSWSGAYYEPRSDLELTQAPDWICQKERPRTEVPDAEAFYLRKGERSNMLIKIAGTFIGLGLDHDATEEFVRWLNDHRSEQPLEENELEDTIFKSMRRYPVGSRLAAMQDYADMRQVEAIWRSVDEAAEGRFFELKSDLVLWKEPDWLIDGWLPKTGIWQLYAPSYAGKTFLVLDLALSICNHVPWFGQEIKHDTSFSEITGQPKARDYVVYILSEGAFDFRQRIEAWITAHPGTDYDKLIVARQKSLDLSKPGGWQKIAHEFSEDTRIAHLKDRIGLVVIDTQSMLLDVEENSNRDMSAAASVLQDASSFMGCPAMLVHHTGKAGDSSRGASSMVAAMDVVMRLKACEDGAGLKQMTFEKVKGAKLPNGRFIFELKEEGPSAWARPLGQDDVLTTQATMNPLMERAYMIIHSDGPQSVTQLRDRIGWMRGSTQDRTFKDHIAVHPQFVDTGERRNRSIVYGIKPSSELPGV